jgi:hypothetical protein
MEIAASEIKQSIYLFIYRHHHMYLYILIKHWYDSKRLEFSTLCLQL